jgi:hypothetical protein
VNEVDTDLVRTLVYSSNASFQAEFKNHLGAEVEEFVSGFANVYRRYEGMSPPGDEDYRAAWVQAFFYSALNSLLVSTHLLVSGYLIQSGNTMRQFAEAMAMGLLSSHPLIDVFERFQKAPKQFHTHKALEIANRKRNRQLLDLNADGWKKLMKITSFYDQFSHVSALGVASIQLFGTDGGVALGSEFDVKKLEMYGLELRRRSSATGPFGDVIETAKEILAKRSPAPPSSA